MSLDPSGTAPLDLSNHLAVRAEMVRAGIAPNQLETWWSPDTESDVNELDDPEVQVAVRRFLGRAWEAAGG